MRSFEEGCALRSLINPSDLGSRWSWKSLVPRNPEPGPKSLDGASRAQSAPDVEEVNLGVLGRSRLQVSAPAGMKAGSWRPMLRAAVDGTLESIRGTRDRATRCCGSRGSDRAEFLLLPVAPYSRYRWSGAITRQTTRCLEKAIGLSGPLRLRVCGPFQHLSSCKFLRC